MRIYYVCDVTGIKLGNMYSLPVPRLSKGLKTITAHLVYTTEFSLAVQSRAC